jgi:hypothetical protein
MSREVFHHERLLTLTLLSAGGVAICVLGYKVFQLGLHRATDMIMFGMLLVLLFFVALQIVHRVLIRITIDPKQRCVTFQYMRAPQSFFDVFPKRRVEVLFSDMVCVREGIRGRGGSILTWHVHTRNTRITYPVFMKNEEQLRKRLQRICADHGAQEENAPYLRSQDMVEKAILVGAVCVIAGAVLYFVYIVIF